MIDERSESRPTAYVLGEMTQQESAAFEAELAESAELRAEVDEIREMAELLTRQMSGSPESLPEEMRKHIEAEAHKVAANKQGAGEEHGGPNPAAVPVKQPQRSWFRRASVWLAAAALTAGSALFLMTSSLSPMRATENTPTAIPATIDALPKQLVTATAPEVDGKVSVPAAPVAVATAAPVTANMTTPGYLRAQKDANGERSAGNRFDETSENPFKQPTSDPLSTFSIDVDTASYALVRSFLERGSRPPAGAVRIEEMINYFSYSYPRPEGDVPFEVNLDMASAPWAREHRLVRVGLRGKDMKMSQVDGVNLVFLVDTSGSMSDANKLPLLKRGFSMMLDKLRPDDQVAIVAYAGSAGLVLPSTPVRKKDAILDALKRLESGGSTNGGAGIDLAYKVAADHFKSGGLNRVILATDGDFNVGVTNNDALVDLISAKAKTGVFLSVLGFGMGNFNDALLEKIADKGNGQYAYIDNETEAQRVLVEGLGGLVTIAKDVKIQIEWNPAEVAGYRLIGYENRTMAARDFNDDKKDAGELGAGHTVTALYEVIPAGSAVPGGSLKYQAPGPANTGASPTAGEVMTVKLRYKAPDASESKQIERVLRGRDVAGAPMNADFQFAAAVASFGMLLRGSKHAGNATFATVQTLAESSAGEDPKRRELVELVKKAAIAR